jgi:hypothetical protein
MSAMLNPVWETLYIDDLVWFRLSVDEVNGQIELDIQAVWVCDRTEY